MKKCLIILSVSVFLGSCTEDVDKHINTDLTLEADQFFNFSQTVGESSYLGNLSYSEYARTLTGELPGCPTVVLTPDSRLVTLDYSTLEECEQENKVMRTGKIVLDFTFSNLESPTWTMTYSDYTYNGIKIEGVRKFTGLSATENQESFENLRVELENNLGFSVDGALSYTVSQEVFVHLALSTTGRIEGRNPAGREFFLTITEAKEQLFKCYQQGWELASKGKESWVVARDPSNSLNYETNFQSTETCNPVVISTLPDGRTLQLNP